MNKMCFGGTACADSARFPRSFSLPAGTAARWAAGCATPLSAAGPGLSAGGGPAPPQRGLTRRWCPRGLGTLWFLRDVVRDVLLSGLGRLSRSLCPLSPPVSEAEKSLAQCERCSAATEARMCYQPYSHPESEMKVFESFMKEGSVALPDLSEPYRGWWFFL